jgi:hypothetical protein
MPSGPREADVDGAGTPTRDLHPSDRAGEPRGRGNDGARDRPRVARGGARTDGADCSEGSTPPRARGDTLAAPVPGALARSRPRRCRVRRRRSLGARRTAPRRSLAGSSGRRRKGVWRATCALSVSSALNRGAPPADGVGAARVRLGLTANLSLSPRAATSRGHVAGHQPMPGCIRAAATPDGHAELEGISEKAEKAALAVTARAPL